MPHADIALQSAAPPDLPAVLLTWPSVPVEVVRAARLRPVFARGSPAPTPAADATVEPDVFASRLRQLFEAALTGALAGLCGHRAAAHFRSGLQGLPVPEGIAATAAGCGYRRCCCSTCCNRRARKSQTYNTARVRELLATLAQLTGSHFDTGELHAQIAGANAGARRGPAPACAAHGPAACQRRRSPADARRVSGSPPTDGYVPLVERTVATLATRAPRTLPRLLLAGAPVDSTTLHAAIEPLRRHARG